jgi:hypothetical protein
MPDGAAHGLARPFAATFHLLMRSIVITKEAIMANEHTRTSVESVQHVARAVADGASQTTRNAVSAVQSVSDGVTQFRAVIRKQPITMAFMMLAMGYILGTHITVSRT